MIVRYILILLFTTFAINAIAVKNIKIREGESLNAILPRSGKSVIIEMIWNESIAEKMFNLGKVESVQKFSACFRPRSAWMHPVIGTKLSQLPDETQFLLIDKGNDEYLMIIPLVDSLFRSCLSGGVNDELNVIVASGDNSKTGNQAKVLYVSCGNNPHEMIRNASIELSKETCQFELRQNKPVPEFVDLLGWCSWNAYYHKVSHENIINTLNCFRERSVPIKWLLIDDGMQRTNQKKLSSFEADTVKFPLGLKGFVDQAKKEFDIQRIIIWHTLWGSWDGVDPDVFPESQNITYLPTGRFEKNDSKIAEDVLKVATTGISFYPASYRGKSFHIPGNFTDFYDRYYSYLSKQGVGGYKVDAMAWIEPIGNQGFGGRVDVMKELLRGIETASNKYFNNEGINCSSSSNDYLFNALSSNVTRTSPDFFPDKPESHGFHILTNAHTSFWMGEIITPDWDMFQSGHAAGAFHAAARSISGGPVYVSEEGKNINPDILKALIVGDGRVLRCVDPGRICKSSLFTDPTVEKLAINIFNKNRHNSVIGTFNCTYDKDNKTNDVKSIVKPSDVEGIAGDNFIVYDYMNKTLKVANKQTQFVSALAPMAFNLYTIAPLKNGFSAVGLEGKYNMGAAITNVVQINKNKWKINVMDGGRLICYAQFKPVRVFSNDKSVGFIYNNNVLTIDLPEMSENQVLIEF